MQSSQSGLVPVLMWVVIIALFVFRMVRPQRFTVTRLWIMPIVLLAVTALAVWGNALASAQTGAAAAPSAEIAIGLIVGALAGIPLGLVRGNHSEVKPTGRPGEMLVHSSPLIVILWIAAFALRALIRYFMPHSSSMAFVIGDGLLAFAAAALITSYAVIYQRYKTLTPSVAGS